MDCRMKIEITEVLDVYVTTGNENKVKKLIDFETLANILTSVKNKIAIKEEKVSERNIIYSSPIFPSFNGVHVLQHIIKDANKDIYIIQREARRSNVAFYDDVFEDVGMPSLIFAITVEGETITNVKLGTVKDKLITPQSKIYYYPLTNVSSNGGICFGGNRISDYKIRSVNDLHVFPTRFLMMPSTHEISDSKTGYNMRVRPLLNHLKGKDFDSEMLVEIGYTYEHWVKTFVELNGQER